ncbi:MAG: response regulator transcription factor [Cyclobacteriaceae bacterium]|nr:response regulator transcription factor [Cyclobacteriaceae bacterium]
MPGIKVLYVEDEPFLAQIVKESLQSRGYQVEHISHGSLALKAFETLQPEICILDVMLPGADGFEIGKTIRNLNKQIPIIFLTAKTQTGDVLQGFSSGGNDYLKKPFSMEELIVRIENLLSLTRGQGEENQPENHQIGAYVFSPKTYELKINGHPVKKLSHRETTLLLMLVNGKNEPVLRKDILMKLWGDDSFYNSRNLDVYLTRLRDYLKNDPCIEIITIKGIGYHMIVKSSP